MQSLTAKDAKYGRPVVAVLAIEEYERLKALDQPSAGAANRELRRHEAT